jgi:peptidoglycan/xylan/chitin deacetylase (PgdA/CDA1 family)
MSTIQNCLLFVLFVCLIGGNAQAKQIALSFDDAPRGAGPMFSGAERAAQLIKSLREANSAPTVFFVKTSGMETEEGRARIEQYAKAGHLIANHTHSHWWLNRTETDLYLADIDQAESLLQDLPNRRPWFRFPYLDEGRPIAQRDAMRQALQERGLKNGYVTVDNFDWYLARQWQRAVEEGRWVNHQALKTVYLDMLVSAVEFYDELAVSHMGRSPAHVLLLHENDLAALYVDELIERLRSLGWEIISPDIAYADALADYQAQTLFAWQGRIAAIASDQGVPHGELRHDSSDEVALDKLLSEYDVFDQPQPDFRVLNPQ